MKTNPKIERYNVLEYEDTMTQKRSLYRVRYLSVPLYKSKYNDDDIYTKEELNFRRLLRQANQGTSPQYIPKNVNQGEDYDHSPISYKEEKPYTSKPTENPTLLENAREIPDIMPINSTLLEGKHETHENMPKKPTLLESQESGLEKPRQKIIEKPFISSRKPTGTRIDAPVNLPVEPERKNKRKLNAATVKEIMEAERINSLINQDGYYNTILPKDYGVDKNEPVTTNAFYIKIGLIAGAILIVVVGMIYYMWYYL